MGFSGLITYNGGSYFSIRQFQPGHSYIVRIVALMNAGFKIYSGSTGLNPYTTWLTPQEGTYNWAEYVCRIDVPSTGVSGDNFGFFYALADSGSFSAGWWLKVARYSVMDISMTSGIDPTTGVSTGLNRQGSIVPNQVFVYLPGAWGPTSITIKWNSQSLYLSDGSTIAIPDNSSPGTTFSGLSNSTTYWFYPYLRLSDMTVQFAGGACAGPSGVYSMQAFFDGRIPLTPISYTTQASGGGGGSGSGGGPGGGSGCPEGAELVTVRKQGAGDPVQVAVKTVETGDCILGRSFVDGSDVYRKILNVTRHSCAAWRIVDGHRVTPCEPIYKDAWTPAYKVPGAALDTFVGTKIVLTVQSDEYDASNYYLTGDNRLLTHNGTILPS